MRHRYFCIFVILACAGLLLAACGESETAVPAAPKTAAPTDWTGSIVAMGDSLTAGLGVAEELAYPARLQARLMAEGYRYRVINAGVSGETSSGALSRLDWVLTLDPDLVILETGANDGLRGIDPALVRENIGEIISRLQERKVAVVLVGMKMVRNLGADYTDAFERIYPEVAAAKGVALVPFMLAGVAGDPAMNQDDGIHPTSEGYAVVTQTLFPYIQRVLDQLRAQGPKTP